MPAVNSIVEYRVLVVDIHGDVESLREFNTLAEAKNFWAGATYPKGHIVTIEGMRDRWFKRTGLVRDFKRTGLVRGKILSTGQGVWLVKDDRWYEAGDEPDFSL